MLKQEKLIDVSGLVDALRARSGEIADLVVGAAGVCGPRGPAHALVTQSLPGLWDGSPVPPGAIVIAGGARLPLADVLRAVRAGSDALAAEITRTGGLQLWPAVAVLNGRVVMAGLDLAVAAAGAVPVPARSRMVLGPVQRRILQLASTGLSTRGIAQELHYSEQAVTYHLSGLMRRFGAPNRTALVAHAVQCGVVDPDVRGDGGAPARGDWSALPEHEVERLVARVRAAAGRSAPPGWSRMAARMAGPHVARLVPAVVDRLCDGQPLDAGHAAALHDAGRALARRGVPLAVGMCAVRDAVAVVTTAVLRTTLYGAQTPTLVDRLGRLGQQVAAALAAGYTCQDIRMPQPRIAPVPHRILELAATGLPTRQIAETLHYSDQAVTYHLSRLMKQFDAPNRTALIAAAVSRRIITVRR